MYIGMLVYSAANLAECSATFLIVGNKGHNRDFVKSQIEANEVGNADGAN